MMKRWARRSVALFLAASVLCGVSFYAWSMQHQHSDLHAAIQDIYDLWRAGEVETVMDYVLVGSNGYFADGGLLGKADTEQSKAVYPESFRFVTSYTSPPLPPTVYFPYPWAVGKASCFPAILDETLNKTNNSNMV